MNDHILDTMYRLIALDPYDQEVLHFERAAAQDNQLLTAWHDFLAEQYLQDQLSMPWRMYVGQSPSILSVTAYHRNIQQHIRSYHQHTLRREVQSYLPQLHVDLKGKRRRRRNLWMIAAAASVTLLVGVWLFRMADTVDETYGILSPLVLMVEPFDLDGVTEEMLIHGMHQRIPAKLAATEGLHPVTHYAVLQASQQGSGEHPAKIVNAGYAVRGRLVHKANELSIEAGLYNVRNNKAMWSSVYTSAADPVAFDDVQDRISLDIARALKVPVSDNARDRLSRNISNDALAVELFLAGERLWAERSRESLAQSIEKFEMALQRDSLSTLIRGYLALSLDTYAENGYGNMSHWQRAKDEANRTLVSDPRNPEALLALGDYAESVEKDYTGAAQFFARALQEQPGDARIHQAIAELHLRTGQIATGLTHMHKARILEPRHRVVRWVETKYLTSSGKLEDARLAAEDLMAMYPDYLPIKNFYWQYHLSRGEYDLALATIPAASSVYAQSYMRGMVYIHTRDYTALAALEQYDFEDTFALLVNVQNDAWPDVQNGMRVQLAAKRFDLLPLFQTSDFAVFNKMKNDPGVVRILEEYGIKAHRIPSDALQM